MQKYINKCCAGPLPVAWAAPEAFPSLRRLWLQSLPLTGTLPPSWGDNGFPSLQLLSISGPLTSPGQLAGTLPSEWGSPTAFRRL